MEEQFKQVESMFLGYLEEEAAKINSEFDHVRCRAYPSASGDQQEYRFLHLFIDCHLKNVELHTDPDNVCLEISSEIRQGKYLLNADICWGHPSGRIEAEIFEVPVDLNEENLLKVNEKLPALVLKLREVLENHPQGKST